MIRDCGLLFGPPCKACLHAYADDTQLYLKCHTQEATTAVHTLEAWTTDVTAWVNMNRLKLNANKTELLWAGSKYGSALLGSSGHSLQLGAETIKASDRVRLLGVTISSDLSLDRHVSTICSTCFYWLRQIRRIRRSLDTDSVAALVHALIASRVDYCNTVLAEAPRTITDRFQRVLNAAVRVVSGTRKFDRGLSQLLHSKLLHWLDIPQRVQYELGITVHRCLQNEAPQYLMDYCTRTSDVSSRQRLRSANRHQLMIPRHRRSTFDRRAFSVAGPMEWNSLPYSLRDPARSTDGFKSALKTHLSAAQRDV